MCTSNDQFTPMEQISLTFGPRTGKLVQSAGGFRLNKKGNFV